MNITHPPMTDEQKDATMQLNNINMIEALNRHNWELQQKVIALTAENEHLRKALKLFADCITLSDCGHEIIKNISAEDIYAAREALGDYK